MTHMVERTDERGRHRARYLTMSEACVVLGVSRWTVYRLEASGALVRHQVAGVRGVRYLADDVARLVAKVARDDESPPPVAGRGLS